MSFHERARAPSRKQASIAFRLLYLLSLRGRKQFTKALTNVKSVQLKKLESLMASAENTETGRRYGLKKKLNYRRFSEQVPVTTYNDWHQSILHQQETGEPILFNEPCTRYQPTSGSSSRMKWIPYPKRYLSELDNAISTMLTDVFSRHKGLFRGRHYWSLSWIPTHLRGKLHPDTNDDMKLLPWWKRIFTAMTMAVPARIAHADTADESLIATLAYLLSCRDLSFMSVWSPTFALNLFNKIAEHRAELIASLETGSWADNRTGLSMVGCPTSLVAATALECWDGRITPEFLNSLWPNMALISSWDTSSSGVWARELQKLFPQTPFLAKGLWATEGVITIPFQDRFPLALTSHFYEFLDTVTGDILPPWALTKDHVYKPLLTTGSGFFRYDLDDRMLVNGFLGDCPCFEFLGRSKGVDLAGEKMTPDVAADLLRKTGERYNIRPLTLVACPRLNVSQKPGYILVCEGRGDTPIQTNISRYAEQVLDESFHYRIASEIGQLNPLEVIFHPDSRTIYQKRNETRGMILGDMKIEPLVLWDESDQEYIDKLRMDLTKDEHQNRLLS